MENYNDHLEVVELLIENGSDLDKANNDGATLICVASFDCHFDVVELLVEKKVNIEIKDYTRSAPFFVSSFNGK